LFADLAIHRAHRSGFPAIALLRAIRDQLAQSFDLGYGFPNAKAVAVYRKTGYVELGQMQRYVRVLRSGGYLETRLSRTLARSAGVAIDGALRGLTAVRAIAANRRRVLTWLPDFDLRFDGLFDSLRAEFPIACERGCAFLRWRFSRDDHRIAVLTDRRTDALRAYAVIRDRGDGCADLVDLLGGDGELDTLLALLLPALDRLDFTAASFRFLGPPRLARLLAWHGFAKRNGARSVVVAPGTRPLHVVMRDSESWYLTDLDEDL
jgi:hypothetical protein